MGACGLIALVVLLLASALVPSPASGREGGETPSSGEGGTATAVAAGGPSKSDGPKESGQTSATSQEPQRRQEALPPVTAALDSKQQSSGEPEKQGKDGAVTQTSLPPPPPPPPPPAQEKEVQKVTPPPEGPRPNGGGDAKGGKEPKTGSQGMEDTADKMKEAMENCDASRKCSFGEEFSACIHLSNNASIRSFVILLNKGQSDITVHVKEASNIDIDKKPVDLAKGVYRQVDITHYSPDGGEITFNDGNGDCVLHIGQTVSDWQQQFQQFAAYARLNPIYGAYIFVFTVILIGGVCVCCKFARRRGNDEVPYQQLEMSAQAPNSSGADNTASTADGWEDGWDDVWDDEEAPARSSDRKPASSVSSNGLTLGSRTDGKDGWDVDWDD